MHIQIYTRIHMHIHLHPFTSMHNRCTCACTDTYGHIHVDTNTSSVQTLWGPFGTCQGNQLPGHGGTLPGDGGTARPGDQNAFLITESENPFRQAWLGNKNICSTRRLSALAEVCTNRVHVIDPSTLQQIMSVKH